MKVRGFSVERCAIQWTFPGSCSVAAASCFMSSAARSSSPSRAVMRTLRTKAIWGSALLLDGIGQGAEALDLDRDLVTVLQQDLGIAEDADAGRGAGGDQVTRLQRDDAGDVGDDLRDREDHLAGRRVLHRLAVEHAADGQRLRVGDLLARHEPRTGRAEGVGRLASGPLPVAELQVA